MGPSQACLGLPLGVASPRSASHPSSHPAWRLQNFAGPESLLQRIEPEAQQLVGPPDPSELILQQGVGCCPTRHPHPHLWHEAEQGLLLRWVDPQWDELLWAGLLAQAEGGLLLKWVESQWDELVEQ